MEFDEPVEIERWARMKIAYHQLLLWGVNDVRIALFQNDGVEALQNLWSILPPEVRDVLRGDYRSFTKSLEQLGKKYEDKLREIQSPMSYTPSQRQSRIGQLQIWFIEQKRSLVRRMLERVIEALDDHGLLREYRSEEVGSG